VEVFYDRDCGFCAWALSWLLRWDRAGALRPVAIQSAEGARALSELPEELRLASWHSRDEHGRVRSGSVALPGLLVRLPGGGPLAVLAARAAGLSERSYAWVASHRTGLSRFVPARSKARARALIAQRMH
jgi:predicted DCC family thiol-disulfide oxidoreductase YuxK